ncbi:MAG: PAS domain S-box protein [Thermoanaerobaculia bacterium]|nr:PAS domain S-box protein [Thermoanaerobaculia bacterium]
MRAIRLFPGSLRGRLILSVALVHAVMMALFVADLTIRQRAMLLERQVEQAEALSRALATSSAGWIAASDVAGLQELVDVQRRYPEILFVALTDETGRVLAGTDSSLRGRVMPGMPARASQAVISRTAALVDVATPATLGGRHIGWARVGLGQEKASERLSAITRDGILYALVAIAAGSLLAWLLGHQITRRLHAVQRTMDRVRRGDSAARAAVSGNDEAAGIAQEFNAMLEALAGRDAELRSAEERYRTLLRDVQAAIVVHDARGLVLHSNPLAQKLLGFSGEQMSGKALVDPGWRFFREDGTPMPVEEYPVSRVLASGQPTRDLVVGVHVPAEREASWLLINAVPETGPKGEILGVIVSFVDITARKRAEDALFRLNRELSAISTCNQTLMRAEDEETLLAEVTRIICEEAGYRLAWVGFLEDDERKSIRPVAWAGHDDGYVEGARLTWADDELGCGPGGTAARTGRTACVQDFATDPRTLPWREAGLKRGYRASIGLPLKDGDGRTFGVVNIYSGEPNSFSDREIALLEELSGDLAFGITTLRLRAERRKAVEALKASESRFRQTLDEMLEGCMIIAPDWTFLYLNEAAARHGRKARTDLIGRKLTDAYPGIETSPVFARYRRCMEERIPQRFRESFTFENGETAWYSLSAEPAPEGIFVLSLDITEEKRAGEERLAHLQFFEHLDRVNMAIQGTNDIERMMSDVLDLVLSILRCDRAFLIFPCDPVAPWWWTPMERTRPEYPGAFEEKARFPMTPEAVRVFTAVLNSSEPVAFGPGSPNSMPEEVSARYGMKSQLCMAVYPKGDSPYMFGLHQCSHPRVFSDEEKRLFREIGRRLTDGLTSLLSYRNLRESEVRLAQAQRIARIGSWEWVFDHKELFFSAETHRIFDLEGGERKPSLETLLSRVHPDDRARVAAAISAIPRTGPEGLQIDYRIIRPDGTTRILHQVAETVLDADGRLLKKRGTVQDITERRRAEEALRISEERYRDIFDNVLDGLYLLEITPAGSFRTVAVNPVLESQTGIPREAFLGRSATEIYPPEAAQVLEQKYRQCASEERTLEEELELVLPAGRRTLHTILIPARDEFFRISRIIAISRDVTEIKRMEEDFRQAQKLEAVGRLAGGVAHDFKNLLTVINGYSELVLGQMGLTDPNREAISEIQKAGERAADLTGQLLAFSRKQILRPRDVDVNGILASLEKFLVRLVGEKVELVLRRGDSEVLARVDPAALEQAITNLAANARDAMPDGGRLVIETSTAEPPVAERRPSPAAAGHVLISVTDTGQGMDDATRDRVFEPFFTTKTAGKGTGLGLAMVYGFVQQSGGHIEVESGVGRGTTFKIYLPRSKGGRGREPAA